MQAKTVELLDGDTVESWEDFGPARPVVIDDVSRAQVDGYVEGVRLA